MDEFREETSKQSKRNTDGDHKSVENNQTVKQGICCCLCFLFRCCCLSFFPVFVNKYHFKIEM